VINVQQSHAALLEPARQSARRLRLRVEELAQLGIIHFGIVAFIERDFWKNFNGIDLSPLERAIDGCGDVWAASVVEFDGEQTAAFVSDGGRATNAGDLLCRAFDCEWVEHAALILYSRITAAQKPDSPAVIEIACISGSVPAGTTHIKFHFRISLTVEVTRQDVPAADGDFTCFANRDARLLEFTFGEGTDRNSPFVFDDRQTDLRDGMTCKKAKSLV